MNDSFRVEVGCFGRVDAEILAAAEQFAETVDLDGLDLADESATAKTLARMFADATPEWSAPAHSCATDPRDGICFAVVQQ